MTAAAATAVVQAVAVLAFSTVPLADVASESVDVIELNHFYDEHGRLVFDQVIFYDWSPADGRHQVRAWRLMKSPQQLPWKVWGGSAGGYRAIWLDEGETGVLRDVRAIGFVETWTQYDPELLEREYLPKEKRRQLLDGAIR